MSLDRQEASQQSFLCGEALEQQVGSVSVRISLKVFTSCEVCAQAVECLSRWGHILLVDAEVLM